MLKKIQHILFTPSEVVVTAFIEGAKTQEMIEMSLKSYQQLAMRTNQDCSNNISYMLLNLISETGELAGKVAKAIRKEEVYIDRNNLMDNSQSNSELEHEMQLELGDVLWQVAGLCECMGWDIEEIARMNLEKLQDRQKRGVIIGDGDHR